MLDDYVASVAAWRRGMEERLRRPNSWLALAGLYWLHDGENRIGADPAADVPLPPGTASGDVGRIYVRGTQAFLEIGSSDPVLIQGSRFRRTELQPDVSDDPTFVDLADLRWVLLLRGGRLAIRVWDNRRPERTAFPPRTWFPIDPLWRLSGAFTRYDPPRMLSVPDVFGESREEQAVGRVEFAVEGKACALEALSANAGELFLIFSDLTNHKSTYPSGRFMYTDAPSEGRVAVDFNRAYNPPCAFTEFATCPLPPAENRLAVEIRAGETFSLRNPDAGRGGEEAAGVAP